MRESLLLKLDIIKSRLDILRHSISITMFLHPSKIYPCFIKKKTTTAVTLWNCPKESTRKILCVLYFLAQLPHCKFPSFFLSLFQFQNVKITSTLDRLLDVISITQFSTSNFLHSALIRVERMIQINCLEYLVQCNNPYINILYSMSFYQIWY